jgi:hypothetical protein
MPLVSGATLLVFLMVVGTTKLVQRLIRLVQSRRVAPAPESKAPESKAPESKARECRT